MKPRRTHESLDQPAHGHPPSRGGDPSLDVLLTTHDGIVLRFSRLPFPPASAELLPLARYELDRHVHLLRGVVGSRVVLEEADNDDPVARRRSAVARRYLAGLGVETVRRLVGGR